MADIRFDKLDEALRNWARQSQRPLGGDDSISVCLRFSGEFAEIEALGFKADAVFDNEAMGVLPREKLGAISSHEGVLWISAGAPGELDLDTATKEIMARATTNSPLDGVWHLAAGATTYTSLAEGTGKDVIVAVIDTGIDYRHPMFLSSASATTTKILRIWDQGLSPASVSDGPATSLLISTNTYGVEFTNTQIDAALASGTPLAHRDCGGHGTHVAGIAAGGPRFASGADNSRTGVAPEASLIAVKYLDVPDTINYRTASGIGGVVGDRTRLRDAIIYCLRTARALSRPIVINISLSNYGESGDGLDEDAVWIDARMDPSAMASSMNFPTGAIIVKSSGNAGGTGRRRTGKVTIPGSGTSPVTHLVDFDLVEHNPSGVIHRFMRCATRRFSPSVAIHFWYKQASPASSVKFGVQLPHTTTFTGDVAPGGADAERRFRVTSAAPPSVATTTAASAQRVVVSHESNVAVPHSPGSSSMVTRHHAIVRLHPKVTSTTTSYFPGTYRVRIKAPPGTEIFYCGGSTFWSAARNISFKTPATPSAGVSDVGDFSSVDPYGRHVITVAAYDDVGGDIVSSSSRGPMRNFADSPLGPIADKPDLAAPGLSITSSMSVDDENHPTPASAHPNWYAGNRFTPKSGTSMATPMVAGVIALMLDKQPALNVTQVRTLLRTPASAPARSTGSPTSGTARTRAFGAGKVDAFTSHRNTT